MSEFNRILASNECYAALRRVEAGADPTWSDKALQAAHRTAMEIKEFIVDAVWERMDENSRSGTRELRAMGSVIRRAHLVGWIEPTERHIPSDRVSAHRNPRRVWKSLLYGKERG